MAGKTFKVSYKSFNLLTRSQFSVLPFQSCNHSVSCDTAKTTSDLLIQRQHFKSFFFYNVCALSFKTRVYSRMSSISDTSTVYANILFITLPQINWNKQDASVVLRSTTCSFNLSYPGQEIKTSGVKLSTKHDISARGSLDCLFGTGKLLRMLQNSGEIQAP